MLIIFTPCILNRFGNIYVGIAMSAAHADGLKRSLAIHIGQTASIRSPDKTIQMTMSKIFSNAVFTLLPADEVPDPLFDNRPDQEEEDDDDYNSYKKAIEGSYDKRYFVDETTGLFCFPRYNKDWQCLVSIRDLTPYKNQYFSYLGPEQRKAFSIDDFEAKFDYPCWEVQDF